MSIIKQLKVFYWVWTVKQPGNLCPKFLPVSFHDWTILYTGRCGIYNFVSLSKVFLIFSKFVHISSYSFQLPSLSGSDVDSGGIFSTSLPRLVAYSSMVPLLPEQGIWEPLFFSYYRAISHFQADLSCWEGSCSVLSSLSLLFSLSHGYYYCVLIYLFAI